MKNKNTNLTQSLKQLRSILEWFDSKEEVDIEEGLKKVKEAAIIIRESKERLREIENEFEEIKKGMAHED